MKLNLIKTGTIFFSIALLVSCAVSEPSQNKSNKKKESNMETTSTEKTKEVVAKFFEYLMGDQSRLEEVTATDYIQHDPFAEDGLQGLRNFFKQIGENYPDYSFENRGLFAEGDLAFVFSYQKYSTEHPGVAVVDVFRVEDGKVVEHWDITQEVVKSKLHDNDMVFSYQK